MTKRTETPVRCSTHNVKAGHLREWSTALAAIGADDLAARLAATADHHDALMSAANNAEATVKAEKARLAAAIAAGELDPLKAAAELDKVEKRAALAGPAATLTTDARRAVIRDEVRGMRAEADHIVHDLANIVHDAADRLVQAVDTLPDGIDTAGAAIAAGAAQEWHQASEAVRIIETAWLLEGKLRDAGVLWDLKPPAVYLRHWHWKATDDTPAPIRTPDNIRAWAELIRSGCSPTIYTAAEMLEYVVVPCGAAPTGAGIVA